MRILFGFVGGYGHCDALVPIARAADAAGHVVAFTGKPAMVPAVEAAGFTVFATGVDVGSTMSDRIPLRRFDIEREEAVIREGFAGRRVRNRTEGLLARCADWQPDLIVCDEVDYGAMIVAEYRGLPYATVLVIAAGSFVRRDLIANPLNQLRAEYGLPDDPNLEMLSRFLVVSPCPPRFRDPTSPLPATAYSIRPTALSAVSDGAAPDWRAGLADVPTVYVTLGTEFNRESGDLFTRVLTGLHGLGVNVVVTVGHGVDPAELGTQPDDVRVERYLPQASVLARCHLVVSHGGSGTVIGALAYGVPQVVLPMGADQALNGGRCEQLGVGRMLDAVDATPVLIRDTVSSMLADGAVRRAAERFRDECRALPATEHAVVRLELLAGQ